MNKFKRIFALILTLCMVLSYVPVGAFAAGSGEVSISGPCALEGISGATEPFPLELFTKHNSSSRGHFRIPAMITLNDGTLVAAADARWQPWDTQDDNGNIDTVVSYSKNNGDTWEVTFGNYFTSDSPFVEDWGSPTIIDPGIVTDGEKIYMIADLFPGQADGAGNCSANAQYAVGYDDQGRMLLRANANTNETGYYLGDNTVDGVKGYKIYAADGTEQTGYTVDAYFNLYQDGTYVRNLFERSTDSFMPVMTPHLYLTVGEFNADGELVWSEPTMLNPILRSASEKYYLVSPGRGIKTKDNVLVIGGYGNASGGEKASIIFFDGESWHRTSREAASVSSETEIVEMNDGTLRMFARHNGNGNYVQYIDWTPVYTDGKVTDYTPSAAVNTTAVAHNNTNVTAIGYSKTAGGMNVILVSCPGDTSGAWNRYNGKIFTFLVNPETNDMTLVNTVEVNGPGEAYSYSCLTELADGTVGLLYEKGDGGNITYAEYDAEALTGLEFDQNYDILVMGSSNTQGTVKVKKTAGVTHVHMRDNTSVSNLEDDYVAYDIVLCKDAEGDCSGFDCDHTHTGDAKVTIPITAELAAKQLKGFVVNGDGTLDYVMDVDITTEGGVNYATFKVPHFSTVGVTPKTPEEIATESKTVTLKVNGTYADTQVGVNLTGSNADKDSAETALVTWTAVGTETTYPTAQLGVDANYNGDIINLNDCLYTFTKGSNNKWTISSGNTVYLDPGNNRAAGYPHRTAEYNELDIAAGYEDNTFTIKANHIDTGNGSTAYLFFDRSAKQWDRVNDPGTNTTWQANVSMRIYKPISSQGTGDIKYFERVTDLADIVDGQYLIVGPDSDGNLYAAYPNAATDNRYCQLAKITGNTKTETQYETAVVIEGVAEGTTAVAVGDVRYDITVAGALTEVDVKLEVGETKNISDDTGYYKPNYTGKGLNTSVATVKVDGTTVSHDAALSSAITSASHFDGTKKYLIVCNRPAGIGGNVADAENSVLTNDSNGTGLFMNGPMSDDSTELWTIKAVTGGYVIKQGDKYLTVDYTTAGMTSTETVLSMDHSTGTGYKTGWRIFLGNNYLSDYQGASNTNAHGWNDAGDEGNYWTIYEVTPAYITGTTSIEIAGVSSGTTSVVVGNTKYNIIVGDDLADVDVPDCLVMRNVSTFTTLNTLPTLPATVCGVLADGTLVQDPNGGNYQYPVVWDSITADMFDTAGEIVTVNGTVNFGDNVTKTVTCTVRVAPDAAVSVDVVDNSTTLAQDLATASDNLQSIKDGTRSPSGDNTNDRWTNWNEKGNRNDATITLTFGQAHDISEIDLFYRYDTTCAKPYSVTFQYSLDGQTFHTIGYDESDLNVTVNNGDAFKYTLNETVKASVLKVTMVQQSGKCLGLYEIEAWTPAIPEPAYNSSADLSGLAAGGATVPGFSANQLQYNVNTNESAVTANTAANAGITILPAYDGVVRVLTVSEDGTAAKTYEITFDNSSLVEIDVDLTVGQSTTIPDNTGNYQNQVNKADGFNKFAGLEVSGSDSTETLVSAAVSSLESGKKYLIVNANNNDLLHNTGNGTYLNVNIDYSASSWKDADVWTLENVVRDETTGNYTAYVKDKNGKYLSFNASGSGVGDTAATVEFEVGSQFTNAWRIECNSKYLNPQNELAMTYGGNGTQANDRGNHWYLYEVTTTTFSSTTITFTGVDVGDTSVIIGNTKYNIHVTLPDPETVDVVLKVGESKPFYIEEYAYTDKHVVTEPNDAIAGMDVFGHYPEGRLSITDRINSGREYLIVVNNRTAGNNAAHNTLAHSAHVNNTDRLTIYNDYTQANTYWVIEKAPGSDNYYYVKTPFGSYLSIGAGTASLTDTPTILQLDYNTEGSYWTIGNKEGTQYLNQYEGVANDYAAGHTNADANSRWEIYERTEYNHTQVIFTGNAKGTTTATVGHVTYNITVAEDVRKVDIYVGETWRETLEGVVANGNNADQSGAKIADVTWVEHTVGAVIGELLNTSGNKTGEIELQTAELTFSGANGKYTIMTANGRYLNISGYPFGTNSATINVTFNENGAAQLATNAGDYLKAYTIDGAYGWSHKTSAMEEVTTSDFFFYLYAPIAEGEESSAEIIGYKRITSADQIVNGQKYLVAFAKGDEWFVAYNNGEDGTSAYQNMARIAIESSEAHTDVTIVGKNPGNTKVEIENVLYDITVNPYEHQFAVEVNATATFEPAADVTPDDIKAFNDANESIVEVALVDGKLVFTGKSVGNVGKYLLGGTYYDIKVTLDVVDGDESKYVGGQSGTQGNGQVITGLIISNNTSYDLNMAADVQGEIRWESSDENVFTIDQNGTVTAGDHAGEAYVNVYLNGSLYQTIPVIVIETTKTPGNNREYDVYNTEVTNCTAYYTYNKEDIAIFPEGYQFYAIHSKTETDLITFYATPNQGYALTFVNGVNGTYYHTVTNPEGTGYLTDDGTHKDTVTMKTGGYQTLHDQLIAYVVNNNGSHAADLATVHKMLEQAVLLEVDGAFFYSRGVGNPDLNDSVRFVADKLPTISKTVNGILGVSGLQVDWQPYQDGMYAQVGEIVYFTIQIEQVAPITFKKGSNNQIATDEFGKLASLAYNTSSSDGLAKLVDNMDDAYFYTKALDMEDNKYDGLISPEKQSTIQDVTNALNRGWTEEELTAGKRIHEYYVVYKIQPSDLNKTISNTVDLDYIFSSSYSYGSRAVSGNAEASLMVLGETLGDLLIDFGLPVVMENIPESKLPLSGYDLTKVNALTNGTQGGCQFGSVEIVKNNDGTYNLTYTPNSVMTNYDVIYIMGYEVEDGKEVLVDGKNVPRLINYIRVRPATTIYYEESFLDFGTGDDTGSWVMNNGSTEINVQKPDFAAINAELEADGKPELTDEEKALMLRKAFQAATLSSTVAQEYQHANCECDTHNNFGYDGKYALENGMSNGTQAVTNKHGDSATFTFNGTGFEIYGNTTTETGIISVAVYRQRYDGNKLVQSLVKWYQVATANQSGDTNATAGQDFTNAYALPLISVNNLEHGTYKVVISHVLPQNKTYDIRLDGFRIYNTVENSDEYYPAEEQMVTFTELRDEVLFAANVSSDSEQIYDRPGDYVSTTAPGATIMFLQTEPETTAEGETESGADTGTDEKPTPVEDWLKKGPKNEIWMQKDHSLSFTLYGGDANQSGAIAFAQIGLKAPAGSVSYKINVLRNDQDASIKDENGNDIIYTITSATDMYYDLPGAMAGDTVIITVTSGVLSVTKLKTNAYSGIGGEPILASVDDETVQSILKFIYGTEDDSNSGDDGAEAMPPEKPHDIVNVVSGVHVYWKAEEGAVKYGLWRSETGVDGTYKWLGNPTVPHFTDTKVESGKTYYYKVTVMDAQGQHSAKSEAVGITYVATPDINTRVNKAAGITLGWNKIEGATGYAIYRKLYSGNSEWARVATIDGNETFTWLDTSVKGNNGTAYKYTVRALAGSDLKTLSGCRNAGRSMVRLSSRVLNSAVKASDTSIKCSWTTSSAVTGYEVRFMIGSEVFKTFTVGNYKTGVKTFTGLKAGQNYKVQVRSYVKIDGMGFYSAWSVAKYANTYKTLTFADIPSSYYFSSGVGAWGTGLDIKADGTMSGSFHDSNMGEIGEGYPNGTVYHCSFSGKFSAPEAVNAYVYKMNLVSYTTEQPEGHVEIKNGIKYIATDAYGIDGADVYYIYLPGTPKDMLPEEVYDWVWRSYGEDALKDSYIICSENNAYPFVS